MTGQNVFDNTSHELSYKLSGWIIDSVSCSSVHGLLNQGSMKKILLVVLAEISKTVAEVLFSPNGIRSNSRTLVDEDSRLFSMDTRFHSPGRSKSRLVNVVSWNKLAIGFAIEASSSGKSVAKSVQWRGTIQNLVPM
jgi:hypothetical protein